MEKSRKLSCYSRFFSEFSDEEENRKLSFSEKSIKAAKKWETLDAIEKMKYKPENYIEEYPTTQKGDTKNYICPKCGWSFMAKYRLKYHLKNCGTSSICEECGKTFKSPVGLSQHTRFVHKKEKSYICGQCEKGFTCTADLQAHYNIHLGVRFVCDLCDETFSNNSNRMKHIKKFH